MALRNAAAADTRLRVSDGFFLLNGLVLSSTLCLKYRIPGSNGKVILSTSSEKDTLLATRASFVLLIAGQQTISGKELLAAFSNLTTRKLRL